MRVRELCIWTFAHIFKSVKRRVFLLLCFICVFIIIIKWRLTCTNVHPRLHIQHICTNYAKGASVGNLCQSLCHPDGVPSLSCHSFYMEKEAVFSGTWMNKSVVFKSLKKSSDTKELKQLNSLNEKKYPTEEEFSKMIQSNIRNKFNISVNDVDAWRMSYIPNQLGGIERNIEMENVWSFLQDNEYLALLLYEKYAIFPKLLGSCGSLYAVQKLNSISGYWHLMTLYDSQEEWEKRIKLSLMILDYLFLLEKKLPEPLHICDVKMNHFGVTSDSKKIMYLDLDSVHPRTIVDKITGDGSQCKQHSDCDFLDCRSFCNLITFKCEYGVVNNNLQIVCERIFLGWVMSGRVMVPGLLLGPRTPRVLIELLELCANPTSELGISRAPASKEIRKRLYNLLINLKLS
ncbi:divergent protein kinase domain 1C [Galleria mellonella]|uniref:Divergent protein kinase domain 1C n=1 Tax=Galleria mellonella TaxID=7137 RepID=A0A6J3CAB5_GALME|nr:divergent protein kinase domain 1C [Galleria mellonella]